MPVSLADLLKAAGEPTRLRILNLLRSGPICVCELQAVLQIPQPTVSRHLAALRHAGLVRDERDGTRVVYSLAPPNTPRLQALYSLLVTASALEEDLLPDLARWKQMLRCRATPSAADPQA